MKCEKEKLKEHQTLMNIKMEVVNGKPNDPIVFHVTKVEGGYLYHNNNTMAFVPKEADNG